MATNYYISIPFRELPHGFTDRADEHTGTASSASDFIELRVMTDTGAGATGVTKKDVYKALEVFRLRIMWDNMGGAPFPAS